VLPFARFLKALFAASKSIVANGHLLETFLFGVILFV
jgi:hypothetical protein